MILYYFTGTTDSDLISQEESPSCSKTVFHLTNGRSNARESATESRLPHYAVKVKGRCKRPPVFIAI